ncbi:tRNA pseudouridine(38-40) synthase TruA [Reichenbachiella versicolor]|uniref:tRNA pseudouridine(38-40) synthase TruA n=1 Tax=Reichenbachiella versicolor TaxID=1821036 RepID=UPI000D6E72FE|nr:tRNA pseudouridine(38-40) synthase TruA [Reichenbachiella versicolor]
MKSKFFYLVEIQYLGFRYHGWAIQPEVNTVQRMVERTLRYVLDGAKFKVLITGRTDALVSANQSYFELFLDDPIEIDSFLVKFNENLPADIRALSIEEVGKEFNVINDPKTKEYTYLFSYGQKNHPFAAPYMCCLLGELDIELMKQGAKLLEGEHDFINFAYKPKEDTVTRRSIDSAEIVANDMMTASFFPEKSYVFKVRGKGFMRHQVRIMMGCLINLGRGDITLEEMQALIDAKEHNPVTYVAPASGLMLNAVSFK